MSQSTQDILVNAMATMSQSGTPFVMATLVGTRGSAPQVVGAKMIADEEGLIAGTIGGGKVEAKCLQYGADMLSGTHNLGPHMVTWHLQDDVGMTCGGEVSIYFEVYGQPLWHLVIFGAGHVAQKLIPLLLTLDCRVTCLDQRAEWLSRLPEHNRLTKIQMEHLPDHAERCLPSDFVLLMTQGHAVDYPILLKLMRRRLPKFLGMIGSVGKAERVRRQLREDGIDKEATNALVSPLGLPIGNNTPPEIAISMVAQLIQKRDQLGVIKQRTKRFRAERQAGQVDPEVLLHS